MKIVIKKEPIVKEIANRIKGYFYSVLIAISFSLKRIDDDLRADPVNLFKTEVRAELRSHIANFVAGNFDEAYAQYFYEVLKKADKFLRTSNPAKIAKAAARHGLDNYGMKDGWGRRFEHYGFYDDKHKYSGMSIREARNLEMEKKTLKDQDNFPVIIMYHNRKDYSFTESVELLNSKGDDLEAAKNYQAKEIHELARLRKIPLTVIRDVEAVNRIEQLTEYVHVKEISSQHKILEFLIPKKFKLKQVPQDDPIFKELIAIKQVWFKDEYGDRNAYRVTKFHRVAEMILPDENNQPDGFDVIKFMAQDIEIIK